jgi:hypothetical protein
MSFRELLDTWEQSARVTQTRSTYAVHLPLDSAARIEALCEMFPGRTREEIITDLLAESLEALAAEMPYVPGGTVIREDDHGDPVYEDLGHTPRYIELTRKHRRTVGE